METINMYLDSTGNVWARDGSQWWPLGVSGGANGRAWEEIQKYGPLTPLLTAEPPESTMVSENAEPFVGWVSRAEVFENHFYVSGPNGRVLITCEREFWLESQGLPVPLAPPKPKRKYHALDEYDVINKAFMSDDDLRALPWTQRFIRDACRTKLDEWRKEDGLQPREWTD